MTIDLTRVKTLIAGLAAVVLAIGGFLARVATEVPERVEVPVDVFAERSVNAIESLWTAPKMKEAEDRTLKKSPPGPRRQRIDPNKWPKNRFETHFVNQAEFKDLPYRASVKLFFNGLNDAGDVVDISCSGAVVEDETPKDGSGLIATASHCLYWGFYADGSGIEQNPWSWNILVCAGYYKGDCTIGEWATPNVPGERRCSLCDVTESQKQNFDRLGDDFGLFTVLPDDKGRPISKVLGAHRIAFPGQKTYGNKPILRLGFPVANSTDGDQLKGIDAERMWECPTRHGDWLGDNDKDSKEAPWLQGTVTRGINCHGARTQDAMGGGSSGGPWLVKVGKSGRGTVIGVTSFGMDWGPAGMIFSPVFGEEEQALHEEALAW